jgi:hypothetical protein
MKRLFFAAAMLAATTTFAQSDTISPKVDTIQAGNFVIIKDNKKTTTVQWNNSYSSKKKYSRIHTNWLIFDLGFTNLRDNTNYATAQNMGYLKVVGTNGKPVTQSDMALNSGKSSNANIWFFMQKLNVTKNKVLNLKYGLGLEMYNFRYDHSISYRNSPTPYVFNDSIAFSKNKLYVGYITVPFMVNVNFTPGHKRGFDLSLGASAGYLVGSHGKQISGERGKQKYHGELGLDVWRLAAITELGLGPVRLYGSYSFNALHKESTGLQQFPYAVGIRFSRW